MNQNHPIFTIYRMAGDVVFAVQWDGSYDVMGKIEDWLDRFTRKNGKVLMIKNTDGEYEFNLDRGDYVYKPMAGNVLMSKKEDFESGAERVSWWPY